MGGRARRPCTELQGLSQGVGSLVVPPGGAGSNRGGSWSEPRVEVQAGSRPLQGGPWVHQRVTDLRLLPVSVCCWQPRAGMSWHRPGPTEPPASLRKEHAQNGHVPTQA